MRTGGCSLRKCAAHLLETQRKEESFSLQIKSQSNALRKLSLLLELALPDANGAWRIPFAKRFLDGQKFGFAMQIGTARNMKELVNIVLGHGHKSGDRSIRRVLVMEAGQREWLPGK